MTRVIAGTLRGRRLRTPAGDGTRPTSDRVRESLFASLTSSFGGLDGLRVLDLYAGSGALGIEAVSRGAAQVDLVDSDRRAVQAIRANLSELSVVDARVHAVTVERFCRQPPDQPYDLVMLDPPYAVPTDDVVSLVASLADSRWCRADGLIVVERSTRDPFSWPDGVQHIDQRVYGETTLWFGR